MEKLSYNSKEAAKIIGISENLCLQMLRAGKIPHIRLGRRFIIPKNALENWFECAGR